MFESDAKFAAVCIPKRTHKEPVEEEIDAEIKIENLVESGGRKVHHVGVGRFETEC